MSIVTLLALASPNQFTGFEHTRIIDLLTVLAFISIAMWAIVCISIVIRQSVIAIMRLSRYGRKHQLANFKVIGKRHGS
jgi:hypothetical protein